MPLVIFHHPDKRQDSQKCLVIKAWCTGEKLCNRPACKSNAWCLTQGYFIRKNACWTSLVVSSRSSRLMYPAKVPCAIAVLLETPTWIQSCPTLTANACSALDETQHWAKAYPLSHHNMAYIPNPTEKLQVSCSHTMPTPLSKSNPNNTHPPLISTS